MLDDHLYEFDWSDKLRRDARIRAGYAAGEPVKSIAAALGVTPNTVAGRAWRIGAKWMGELRRGEHFPKDAMGRPLGRRGTHKWKRMRALSRQRPGIDRG